VEGELKLVALATDFGERWPLLLLPRPLATQAPPPAAPPLVVEGAGAIPEDLPAPFSFPCYDSRVIFGKIPPLLALFFHRFLNSI
jgi:hypothetical protein